MSASERFSPTMRGGGGLAVDPAETVAAMQTALHDAIAFNWRTLGFAIVVSAAGYAVWQVFASFIAPLGWAVVTGAALYQLKKELVTAVLKWLESLSHTPGQAGTWGMDGSGGNTSGVAPPRAGVLSPQPQSLSGFGSPPLRRNSMFRQASSPQVTRKVSEPTLLQSMDVEDLVDALDLEHVSGTPAEYEARLAREAAEITSYEFSANRRPLVLGLLLLPLSLLSTVADMAYELVVTCKETRWRVLCTVGALVALSRRPAALVLLVNTVTQLQYMGTAGLVAVGWYQEYGNQVSLALFVTALAVSVSARMVQHAAIELGGCALGGVVILLQLCRTGLGFSLVVAFATMLLIGWRDERKAVRSLIKRLLDLHEADRRTYTDIKSNDAATTRSVGRDLRQEARVICFRLASEAILKGDFMEEWTSCRSIVEEHLFDVQVDDFDASDAQGPSPRGSLTNPSIRSIPTASVYLRMKTGEENFSSPWPRPLEWLPSQLPLPHYTFEVLMRSSCAIVSCSKSPKRAVHSSSWKRGQVRRADGLEIRLWDPTSGEDLPDARPDQCVLLRLQRDQTDVGMLDRCREAVCLEFVLWESVELIVHPNRYFGSLKVGRNAFVVPEDAAHSGGAVVAVPASGRADIMWSDSTSASEPLIEYVDGRLRKWYHMDWHLFSLLLSCVLVWLGDVWCVLFVSIICVALAFKWVVSFFESTLSRGFSSLSAAPDSFASLLPAWFSVLVHRLGILYLRADAALVRLAQRQAHTFVSVLLIVGLAVGLIISSAVIALRVQREGAIMVSSFGSFVVNTVNRSATLQSYLPSDDDISTLVNTATNSTYGYARQYIVDRGTEIFGPSFNFTEIEVGVDRLWRNTSTPNCTSMGELPIEKIVRLALSGDVSGAYDQTQGLLSDDDDAVSTLLSHFDLGSISEYLHRGGQVVTQNLHLVLSVIVYTLTLVVNQSVVVGQFAVEVTTYMLALFYLLSTPRFAPMDTLKQWLPREMQDRAVDQVYRTISAVFVVTWKMSFFHGWFMWLTLRIFLSRNDFDNAGVVTSCIVAAIVSVVPVMPSFMVAIPHAIGIWLRASVSTESDNWVLSTAGLLDALLFFGLHVYVYWEISPRIYDSLHEETPYFLVSMSVVGGIVYAGLSGAVIGPLILSTSARLFSALRTVATRAPPSAVSPNTSLRQARGGGG
eukprot:CAMPEP_0206292470 /NCGR_PEP_ID=MMETSP0106_2-20121207/3642_1 /ASSEMBLY_ACC=CAM_ASM_000206 /TAXON_ID=81532 /ORGANISM="Acanthoeca-like sp., Strain 10tr" /LENGTH=1179 /DNA_ID=CAMNT_0053723043 /DNA_START=298 /DNA_END=3834 /DNA_ORIENTATION=+